METLVPSPETPVEIGRPVQLVNVPDAGVPNAGVVNVGLVRVLLVNVSVPASVANVPLIGSVTLLAAVVVNVRAKAPFVASVLPLANVSVALVAGAVIATLLDL